MDNQSIQHTRWNCTYHIVFIPKYRRKVMYGEVKRDVVEILKKLCEMKREFDSSIIKKTFAGRINPVLFLSNFSFLYMLFYVIV